MSVPVYDIDEGLWQKYLVDCQVLHLTPGMSDFLVWLDEHNFDRPELYDGPWGVVNG